MRVVVAGSTGLIGTALIGQLRHSGHEVLRLVRRAPAAPDERGWDPPSGRIDDGALDDIDAVVNLCGNSQRPRRWSGAYKQHMRDSRVVPTEVLAAAVAEHGVPSLVSASGVHYYGDTGETPVDETAPGGHGFLAELSRDWEAATAPAVQAGARVAVMRTGVVLSRSGGFLSFLRPLFKLGLGGKLGSGRQFMSWISLDDHVRAIEFAAEGNGLRGPVNSTGPDPVPNVEFTRALAHALGRPAFFAAPGFGIKLVLGEAGEETALISQRVLPAALETAGFRFRHNTVSEALAAAVGS